MNRLLLTALVLLISSHILSNNMDTLNCELEIEKVQNNLNKTNQSLRDSYKTICNLQDVVESQKYAIDSLKLLIKRNSISIDSAKSEYNKCTMKNANSTKALEELIGRSILYGSIISFFIILFICVCVFYFYRKFLRVGINEHTVNNEIDKLINNYAILEKEILYSNDKLIDEIEKQLAFIKVNEESKEIDHSLAIAVANELTRIQQNLNHMDAGVKGVSQLKNRAKALLTTLNSKQYEIPDLLGTTYNEGSSIIATLELNEDLDAGVKRIKRIIKPQVSYKGKLIQAAEVVVEYND